ncbi:hypothetical protein ACW582_19725 [Pseudomonas chlororaphis]
MKTLHFIPLPLFGESPRSLIRRLATMNGYSTISKFTGHFFGYGISAHGSSLIQGNRYESLMLSQVSPIFQERIHNCFYPLANQDKSSGAFLLGKLKVGRRLLRAHYFPVCSECCDSDHFQYITDLCLCKHCPLHLRKLIFKCPSCNRPLRLKHQGRLNCNCGADWQSPICTEDECLPEKRLLQILEQQDQKKLDALLSAISTFGIARNKIQRTSHTIFDAAASIVFDDIPRLEKLLRIIWSSLDLTQAEILAVKFKKYYPKLAHLIEVLPKKCMTACKESPSRPLRANGLRTLLGISTEVWTQFLAAHPANDKHSYDGQDVTQLSQAIEDFKAKTREQRGQLEFDIVSSCYSLSATSKLLGLSLVECKILSDQDILAPLTTIRTRPYYRKEDVLNFQTSFVATRKLASRFGKTYIEMIAALNRCEAVKPIINRSGYPFLIRTEDIPRISSSIGTIPKKTKSLKGQKKLHRCVTTVLKTCTLDQAAAILKTHRNTVIYYRDIGLIRCSEHNTRIFALDDVANFYKRFTTPRVLCKELNLPSNKLSGILETHNIRAISGKFVNGHSITVYDRSTFPTDLQAQLNPTSDTFGIYLSRNQVASLREAAQLLGIKYSEMRRLAKDEIRPARSPLYRSYLTVSHDEISSLRKLLASLTPLPHILQTYGLTHQSFSRRFISRGFVRLLKFNDQEYLTRSDANKLNTFTKHYCTFEEASKILGLSSAYISTLVKQRKIATHWVPDYGYKYPLLKKKDVQTMLNCRR